MRDLLFKNLTSQSRRRKVIASVETSEQQGVHSVIRRHFIYVAKEVKKAQKNQVIKPFAYVRKERNTKNQEEKFYCKLKGAVYTKYGEKVYLIHFMHTLNIHLSASEFYN